MIEIVKKDELNAALLKINNENTNNLLKNDLVKLKLRKLFKMGYLPSRGDEIYKGFKMCNCVGHALFNLDNELLKNVFEGTFQPRYMCLEDFVSENSFDIERATRRIIASVGLKIHPSTSLAPLHYNQWKIALYECVSDDPEFLNDYHVILQRNPMCWEQKLGWDYPEVNIIHSQNPPPQIFHFRYKNSYIITNPHCESNQNGLNNEENI